jgi:phosphatidylserine decarboxylase
MLEQQQKQFLERAFGGRAAVGVSHIMGRLAAIPLPSYLLNPLIKLYSRGVGVDSGEYQVPEAGFKCFNEFFGRRLRPGARPLSAVEDGFVSPCDGQIVARGTVNPEGGSVLHVKGSTYTLPGLLGWADAESVFAGGRFLVIYLHPRDYHRVHVPAGAALKHVVHIPGARFPVTSWCDDRVEGIYEKNERMVFALELPNGKALALVMVAAFGVGNIDSAYGPGFGEGQNARRTRQFESPPTLVAGDELGAFLLGSTVVMVWSEGAVDLDPSLELGSIALGRQIGRVGPTSPPGA